MPNAPYLFRKPFTAATYRNYRVSQVVVARILSYGFLVVALVGLVLALVRRRRPDPLLATVITATLLVSVANVLAEGDDVPRFLEPFHAVLVLVVVIAVTRAGKVAAPRPGRPHGPGLRAPPRSMTSVPTSADEPVHRALGLTDDEAASIARPSGVSRTTSSSPCTR